MTDKEKRLLDYLALEEAEENIRRHRYAEIMIEKLINQEVAEKSKELSEMYEKKLEAIRKENREKLEKERKENQDKLEKERKENQDKLEKERKEYQDEMKVRDEKYAELARKFEEFLNKSN